MREVGRLSDLAPGLERILRRNLIVTPPKFAASAIRIQTLKVSMRDQTLLATDVYLPPVTPAPVLVTRTPYGRGADTLVGVFLFFARRGYVVVSQDCRGTGDSEPDHWDYYIYEPEDGYDFVEWISRQTWFNGFLAACGSSYAGQTQWHMALHPRMSTIVPEVSGLGVAVNTARLHMFCNAYERTVGKGDSKVPVHYSELERQILDETLSSGYFNEPLFRPLPGSILTRFPGLRMLAPVDAQRWLWELYCSLPCAQRAELVKQLMDTRTVGILEVERLSAIFGHWVSHDAHTLPHPRLEELCRELNTPVLLRTGWYDWGLNDALATWGLLQRAAAEQVRPRCRLLIAPSAHNMPGYHEGMGEHPELHHAHTVANNCELLLCWYDAIQEKATDAWPTVIYYLMGANEWRVCRAWPPPGSRVEPYYLGPLGTLSQQVPRGDTVADRYTYDPTAPTPTLGGSIVSYVYPPGSVDVSELQLRSDVVVYTSAPLEEDLVVVGSLRLVLYASSTAVDTDFAARLTDVFPDGRAIQLQNGILRARYRELHGRPELLEPGRIYRLEIDMWATANLFRAGHRLRLDISSADFPRFDRNSNRGGEPGEPVAAVQTIYHDIERPSHLLLPIVG
jgi:uncharacterized protein